MEQRDLIGTANELVSITKACNMLGMDVADYASASMKLYCPFGHMFHQDGGASKSMRIYPETNSAWCFAGCGYFTPTKLIAMDRDIPEVAAAELLLDEIHYVPPDFESVWDSLMEPDPVDTVALAEALKTACARMTPRWDEIQFESRTSAKLTQCLSLLKKVRTAEDATKWLSITREAMRVVIGEST